MNYSRGSGGSRLACLHADLRLPPTEEGFPRDTPLHCHSNHFFRVDKGFVAQTADVVGGRTVPLNAEQEAEARKTVPLEVKEGVKHHEGGK